MITNKACRFYNGLPVIIDLKQLAINRFLINRPRENELNARIESQLLDMIIYQIDQNVKMKKDVNQKI